VPEPVVTLDLDGAVQQVNPAFLTLMGAEDERTLVGRAFLELVERGDRARVTAELARALFMQRRHTQLELQLTAPERGVIPCSVSAGHLRGPRRHLQLVIHDLSERHRAESERSHLSEQLARAQRLDAVGQIAGGLAHDLNNLLVVMVSNLSLARESVEVALSSDGGGSLEEVREDLGELQVAVDRAESLTSKLLQFARQEEGAKGEADVVQVVTVAARLVERSLGDDIELEFVVDGGVPTAAVDPVHLERVLVNLLINARDAIDGAGSICLEVQATEDGSSVRVAVRDDGCGMDDATRARAFEPLFTTRAGMGGSGLGLATVLAFVEGVDGEVALDSVEGQGTTVALTLPVHAEEAPDLPVGVDVPIAGARVVLVDPGERTRRVIATMLTGAGYRVRAVASAEAALEVLKGEGGDVLITELALPGMPGTRLIQDVERTYPQVQRLVVAPVGQSTPLRGTPALAKPFSHTRLLRAVEDLVRNR
jgi:PAS domain S-box-containing protein